MHAPSITQTRNEPADGVARIGTVPVPGKAGRFSQLVGDLACYWCGERFADCLLLRAPTPESLGQLARMALPTLETFVWQGGRPHCKRCGGPLYLEDVRQVRVWNEPIADFRQRRRSRRYIASAEAEHAA